MAPRRGIAPLWRRALATLLTVVSGMSFVLGIILGTYKTEQGASLFFIMASLSFFSLVWALCRWED